VFGRLARLWADYQRSGDVPAGGTRDLVGATVRGRDGRVHTLGAPHADGDIAALYRVGPAGGPPCLAKIARSADDDDLVAREAAALRRIARLGDPRYGAYLPTLEGTGRLTGAEDEGITRRVNILGRLDGFATLAQVRAAYPDGIDVRDAAWMWRRLLVALGYAHRAGVAHGAVLPEHVLIHPAEHGLVLVDWCYSATPDADDGAVVGRPPSSPLSDDPARRIPAMVARYAAWYPPEVARREVPGAATDLALASRCMAYLLGDPEPDRLRGQVPAALRRFLTGCLLPAPSQRPDDAWALLAELDELLARLYGPRRFRPFHLPEQSAS
jgi:hypothetical protein